MIKIHCDKCNKITNEGEFNHTPPKITLDRGSNTIIGRFGIAGVNCLEYDLCDGCFQSILDLITENIEDKND